MKILILDNVNGHNLKGAKLEVTNMGNGYFEFVYGIVDLMVNWAFAEIVDFDYELNRVARMDDCTYAFCKPWPTKNYPMAGWLMATLGAEILFTKTMTGTLLR